MVRTQFIDQWSQFRERARRRKHDVLFRSKMNSDFVLKNLPDLRLPRA